MLKAFNETKERPFGGQFTPNKQFLKYITGIIMEAIFVEQLENKL